MAFAAPNFFCASSDEDVVVSGAGLDRYDEDPLVVLEDREDES